LGRAGVRTSEGSGAVAAGSGMHDTAVMGLVCSGRGECVDGRCVCDAGFRSFDCSRLTCENGCSGHGSCGVDGQCACYPGWFGSECAFPTCFRNCSGHGVCESSAPTWLGVSAAQALCKCDPGWRGVGCEQRTCPASSSTDGGSTCGSGGCAECSRHGTCNPATGACDCAAPWSGPACDVFGCGPKGCGTHGECVAIGTTPSTLGRYGCACEPGWGAEDCTLQDCANGCGDAGWCLNGICLCYPGSEAKGKCSSAANQLSLRCSLRCVNGCASLCARGVAGAEQGARVACEAECSRRCLQVCATG